MTNECCCECWHQDTSSKVNFLICILGASCWVVTGLPPVVQEWCKKQTQAWCHHQADNPLGNHPAQPMLGKQHDRQCVLLHLHQQQSCHSRVLAWLLSQTRAVSTGSQYTRRPVTLASASHLLTSCLAACLTAIAGTLCGQWTASQAQQPSACCVSRQGKTHSWPYGR